MMNKIAKELLRAAKLIVAKGNFSASPYYDNDTGEEIVGWGVWYDDGREYDWVVDNVDLTERQAERLAKKFNKLWNTMDEIDWKMVRRMS